MIESVWVFPEPVTITESGSYRRVTIDGIATCAVRGRTYSVPLVIERREHVHGGKPTYCEEAFEADVHLPFEFLSSDWRRATGALPAIQVCRVTLPGWET